MKKTKIIDLNVDITDIKDMDLSQYFTAPQIAFIESGKQKRIRMRLVVDRATKRIKHLFVYSEPGLGKTYTVEQVLNLLEQTDGIAWASIEGNASLFGFGCDLAYIDYHRDKSKPMFVFIDDCDSLLLQSESVNTLKKMLDTGNTYSYNKSLMGQYNGLDDDQKEIIDHYRTPGKSGFKIELTNITFIWCSNYKLADQQDLAKLQSATKPNSTAIQKAKHEIALRRRMDAKDFDLLSNTSVNITWGWIADCILTSTPPSMVDATLEDKVEILNWMYRYWTRIKEQNISFAEKLWQDKVEDSDGYETTWELDHLV